ncbi:hypothetical protein [Mycoplasmopsis californica]|uniref:hypothetical protein n=1 Tax=Mycoplasmopsis californica TaxID=2113 RepID=UPI000596F821|nr:hypothetical protein [Mycoplasmopsis californica]BBG40959.1 hypothetical protein MCAL106_0573 [Mycoplasmopsis californica]BBG41553.1 hypothetical protein MCAL106E_0573 [Mycoplasmopsis californica]BBG42146.1 hypothetical protein MCAL106L_0573 [Mycoplasmopsis californica]
MKKLLLLAPLGVVPFVAASCSTKEKVKPINELLTKQNSGIQSPINSDNKYKKELEELAKIIDEISINLGLDKDTSTLFKVSKILELLKNINKDLLIKISKFKNTFNLKNIADKSDEKVKKALEALKKAFGEEGLNQPNNEQNDDPLQISHDEKIKNLYAKIKELTNQLEKVEKTNQVINLVAQKLGIKTLKSEGDKYLEEIKNKLAMFNESDLTKLLKFKEAFKLKDLADKKDKNVKQAIEALKKAFADEGIDKQNLSDAPQDDEITPQTKSDTEQLKKETEQLKQENIKLQQELQQLKNQTNPSVQDSEKDKKIKELESINADLMSQQQNLINEVTGLMQTQHLIKLKPEILDVIKSDPDLMDTLQKDAELRDLLNEGDLDPSEIKNSKEFQPLDYDDNDDSLITDDFLFSTSPKYDEEIKV